VESFILKNKSRELEIRQHIHHLSLQSFYDSYPECKVESNRLGCRYIDRPSYHNLLPFQTDIVQYKKSAISWYLQTVRRSNPVPLSDGAEGVCINTVVAIAG